MTAADDDDPSVKYGDGYFHGGSAGYPDYLGESDLLSAQGRRYAAIIGNHTGPGSLLDVGCAAGFISSGFAASGWKTTGIDPNPSMARYSREVLGLPASAGTLEHLDSIGDLGAPSGGFDLILLIQVIAHLFDIDRALRQAKDFTRPGGHWLVETWDSESLTARLLGRLWHEYSPPTVLHYFSRRSLTRLMSRHGFEIVASGRPVKRIRLDHANSLLRYKYGGNAVGKALCSIVARLPANATLAYPAEDLFWALFKRFA